MLLCLTAKTEFEPPTEAFVILTQSRGKEVLLSLVYSHLQTQRSSDLDTYSLAGLGATRRPLT